MIKKNDHQEPGFVSLYNKNKIIDMVYRTMGDLESMCMPLRGTKSKITEEFVIERIGEARDRLRSILEIFKDENPEQKTEVSFAFGTFADSIESQVRSCGYTTGREERTLQRLHDSMVACWINGLITDSQYEAAAEKLAKKIRRIMVPIREEDGNGRYSY